MTNPIQPAGAAPLGPAAPAAPTAKTSDTPRDAFAAMLRSQIQQVSAMQSEADENVTQLLTGGNASVTDVFVAARKAEVAFSLLMEIRNKLVDAYEELKNMRV